MAIKVTWVNSEKTIAQYNFEGRWTWDDLYHAVQEIKTMLDSVPHQVDIVIDLRNNQSVPPGTLIHLRSITLAASPNWGMGVFVGVNGFIRTLLTTFVKVYPKLGGRYAIVESPEAALALIAERRKKHPSGGNDTAAMGSE
jgi:hypothetical protein